jgi:hypothetical protein
MNATNNIWQKNRVSVLTPGSSTRRHQQTKTASTNKIATLAKYPINVMMAVYWCHINCKDYMLLIRLFYHAASITESRMWRVL